MDVNKIVNLLSTEYIWMINTEETIFMAPKE